MKFKDLKIGQKFRFTGPEQANDILRLKVSSRTFTNPERDEKKASGKTLSHNSRVNSNVVVAETRMLSFKEYLEEELASIPKWWYNAKTRKAVKVTRDFHIQQVFSTPEAFDLSKDDLAEFAPKTLRLLDRIEKLAKPLRKKGWVEVTWSKRPDTVLLRADTNAFGQKTLNWFLKKINPNPKGVGIVRPDGSEDLDNAAKIDTFAKTGRNIKQTAIGATMARFR